MAAAHGCHVERGLACDCRVASGHVIGSSMGRAAHAAADFRIEPACANAAGLTNAQQSTTQDSDAGRAKKAAGLADIEDLSDRTATNHPPIRTDSDPKTSSASVWNVATVIVGWIYAYGIAIALMRLVANRARLNALRYRALSVTDGTWLARLEHWKARLGLTESESSKSLVAIRSPVRLLSSDRIVVPMAPGATQRAIVIPSRMVADASPPMIDLILTHELAHIARADYAWQFLQRLVQAFLWFHPLWWISARRIAYIREARRRRFCGPLARRHRTVWHDALESGRGDVPPAKITTGVGDDAVLQFVATASCDATQYG